MAFEPPPRPPLMAKVINKFTFCEHLPNKESMLFELVMKYFRYRRLRFCQAENRTKAISSHFFQHQMLKIIVFQERKAVHILFANMEVIDSDIDSETSKRSDVDKVRNLKSQKILIVKLLSKAKCECTK